VNVRETEEMIFDPKSIGDRSSGRIHNIAMNDVSSFKYLGVTLTAQSHGMCMCQTFCSRLHERMYLLKRLGLHGILSKLMIKFHQMILESVIRYDI